MNIKKNKDAAEINGSVSRRDLLKFGMAALIAAAVPGEVLATLNEYPPERKLSLYNYYTQENLETVFWRDGQYVPEALAEINHLFRDTRTGEVKEINKSLLDILFSMQQKLNSGGPIHIISGYRTPRSNALLRKRKKGVAKNSFHMYGKAVDLRVPGYSLKAVRRAAMSIRGGGVGYYPRSKFVHLDVGQVRYWWG